MVNGTFTSVSDQFSAIGASDGDLSFSVDVSRVDAMQIKCYNTGTNGVLTFNATVRQ